MGRVTIKDLARASGFSVCTINKALNGKPWVSENTRRRVLELAETMGYRPNRLAQALARRTLALAVLYPRFWEHWFSPLVEGVRSGVTALQDHNIDVQFCPIDGPPGGIDLAPVIRALAGGRLDGLVICVGGYTLLRPQETAALLNALQRPVVLLGGDHPDLPHLACVRVDTHRCGVMANELLGLLTGGAPAAVFIGLDSDVNHRMKVDGFRACTGPAACPLAGVYETREDPETAYRLAGRLFHEHPEVGGIFVAIDNSSPDICRYLLDHDLAGRIKVVATGVFPEIGELMRRGVVHCSLFQGTVEQGRLAIRTLFRHLSEGVVPERQLLVPPFVALNSNFDLWQPA